MTLFKGKNMKTIWIALLVVSALTGCGSGSSSGPTYTNYYTPEDYSGLKNELRAADFFCASGLCPENVGLLLINKNGSESSPALSQCSSFLIANDILATNSHCIPDYLKGSGSSCEGKMAVRFLNRDVQKSIFGCKKVLFYSSLDKVFGSDVAFLQIEPTGITPFQIHKEGLKDDQKITMMKVNPWGYKAGGTLEVENCNVAWNTLLNIKATGLWSETGLAWGCHVIQGNSGSPVVAENGQVLGVMQSLMTENWSREIEKVFKSMNLRMPNPLPPHGNFTNLSCIADPVTGQANIEKCETTKARNLFDCVSVGSTEKSKASAEAVFQKWKSELPSIFVYEFITSTQTQSVDARPLCVKPKEKFADYNKYVSRRGILGFRKDAMSFRYPRTIFIGSNLSLDSRMKLSPDIQYREADRLTYQVEVSKEEKTWNGSMNSSFSNLILGIDLNSLKVPVSLEECTDQQLNNTKDITRVNIGSGTTISEEEYNKLNKNEKKSCE